MRTWLIPLLAVLAVLAPPAMAQDVHFIPAGSVTDFGIEGQTGDTLKITVSSNQSIDVFLVSGGNSSAYFSGNATVVWSELNVTVAQLSLALENNEPMWLILDNSPQPEAGAMGDRDVAVQVDIQLIAPALPPAEPAAPERSLWRALMFTADYWDLAVIGLAGVALWMLVFAVAAAYRFEASASNLAVLAGGVAVLTASWSLIPHPGVMTQVGLPILIGAGAGYLSAQGSKTFPAAIRFAALGSILGSLVGLTVGHYIHGTWADVGMLVLGGERFVDALFTVPVVAVGVAAVLKFVPAFVEALDDDETRETKAAATPLSANITVTCIRCGTAVTVNRSVKRFRIAMDHVEFPCPNCQAAMEWRAGQNPTS